MGQEHSSRRLNFQRERLDSSLSPGCAGSPALPGADLLCTRALMDLSASLQCPRHWLMGTSLFVVTLVVHEVL